MHLKHINYIIIIAGCLFMLVACTNNSMDENIKQQNNQGLELNKINANSPVDQQSANQAKHLLSKYEEIKSVRTVNHDKQLLVAVQLKHHDRFNKNDIEKKLTKDVNKHFADIKVTSSTDEKIHLDVKKLEQALQKRKLSKKELAAKIKKIISLSKEKT